MKLKERLETASPEEKEEIRKQLEAIEAERVLKLVKKKEAAERKREANRVVYTKDSLLNIKVEGPPKYYVGEWHEKVSRGKIRPSVKRAMIVCVCVCVCMCVRVCVCVCLFVVVAVVVF